MSLMKIWLYQGAKDTGVPTALEIKKRCSNLSMIIIIWDMILRNRRY
jgi:hypothetical protein